MKKSIPDRCSLVQLRLQVFCRRLPAIGRRFLLLAVFLLPALAMPARGQSTHSFNSGMNCYGVFKLPDTGQAGNVTDLFGEDHDYTAAQSSYTVISNLGVAGSSVTLDNITGLIWITNPATDAAMGDPGGWASALTACEDKNYAGYSDWRLPNVRELMSIVTYNVALITDFEAPPVPLIDTVYFPGTFYDAYWTSTTYFGGTASAWTVNFTDGTVVPSDKSTASHYIRCVRGGP